MKNPNQALRLCDIRPGHRASLLRLPGGSLRQRLLDLGFSENTVIECVGVSPAGDPAAYLLRGTVVALRRADSADILVKPCS